MDILAAIWSELSIESIHRGEAIYVNQDNKSDFRNPFEPVDQQSKRMTGQRSVDRFRMGFQTRCSRSARAISNSKMISQ
jgi:hypothetical protein